MSISMSDNNKTNNKVTITDLDTHKNKLIDSRDLLHWNRWDILAKYYYTYLYFIFGGDLPKWVSELYSDHILVLNGGMEEETHFQTKSKHGLESFIYQFHDLINKIKNNGFDNKFPIPITSARTILNGGHRIAISANLGLHIPINLIPNINTTLNFTSFCFQDRIKYESLMPKLNEKYKKISKNSLQQWQNDSIALHMLLNNTCKYKIVVFFSESNFVEHQSEINKFWDSININLVYQKPITLTRTGIYKMIQHLYCFEPKVSINNKTSHTYHISHLNDKYKSIIQIITGDVNTLIKLSKSGGQFKTQLRNILGHNDTIHISDTDNDTLVSGKLFLNQASLDFINSAAVNIFSKTQSQFTAYHKYIDNLYKLYQNTVNTANTSNTVNTVNTLDNMDYNNFQNSFCIVSSFVLSLYGIRVSNDIDFIYNNEIIPVSLHDRINKISHNKYSKYYDESIKNIIYNPELHFYYMGWKCLTLDGIYKMKTNRAEIKDIVDCQLINNFTQNYHLKHNLTIITTTHIIPSAPSTHIIETMLESLHKHIAGSQFANHLIFLDSNVEDDRYQQYLNNLMQLKEKYPNIYIIDIPASGLKANYINGIKLTQTPIILFMEHDWIFTENIPIDKLINVMNSNNNVNYIKFSKRNNMEIGGWDKILEKDTTIKTINLIKTDSWTNHPHLVKKTKWIDEWLTYINPNIKATKSYGLEDVMYNKYQNDIKIKGFAIAHKKWGCYNWETYSGKSCIYHEDGSEHYINEKNK